MENDYIPAYDESSLMRQVPHVLRARGFRLYLENGKRLIDLFLNGGAAVLGHTPPNLLREIKNSASRGLYAPYPHFTENRYIKALSKILPGRSFRLYAAPPEELTSFSNTIKLWRPFNNPENPFKSDNTPLIIPVLPGIQSWRTYQNIKLPLGLCIAAVKNELSESVFQKLPESDMFSSVLLAAAARGVYDILASAQRAKPKLPRTFKALKSLPERWHKQGIYLKLRQETNDWKTLFHQFLDAGFLLPPNPSQPVILPGELSDGEDAKLAALLTSIY